MNYYDIFPQTVPADRISEIRIRPRFAHKGFHREEPWKMDVVLEPVSGQLRDGVMHASEWGKRDPGMPFEWHFEGDTMVVKAEFAGEQEYNLQIFYTLTNYPGYQTCDSFRFYSLKPDLLSLVPLKGNTHAHTTGSDGREEPAYVAGRYRQKGYDFLAITDHLQYAPSVQARDHWRKTVPDFELVPGEEVHSPENPVHIVNFGGKYSVNDLFRNDREKYFSEVREIMKKYDASLPEHVRFSTAGCKWVFDRIRSAGGLAIFAHPYWREPRTVLPEAIIDSVFRENDFDALEVLGGFYNHQFEDNNFQVIRYFEEKAKGKKLPVVGASDSHCTDKMPFAESESNLRFNGIEYNRTLDGDLFDWYFSIVFAEENSTSSIINAIRNSNSVAVDRTQKDHPVICGDLRLVRYASFLLREYFPIHERLCCDQGSAMLDHLAGEENAGERLKLLEGRVGKFRNLFFSSGK